MSVRVWCVIWMWMGHFCCGFFSFQFKKVIDKIMWCVHESLNIFARSFSIHSFVHPFMCIRQLRKSIVIISLIKSWIKVYIYAKETTLATAIKRQLIQKLYFGRVNLTHTTVLTPFIYYILAKGNLHESFLWKSVHYIWFLLSFLVF